MLRTALLAAAACAASLSSAVAGGLSPVPAAPVVTAPATPAAEADRDWSGFYAGAQLGSGEAEYIIFGTAWPEKFSGTTYGAHVGYLHDFGKFVTGVELSYDNINELTMPNGEETTYAESMLNIKLRAGYDLGRLLPYVNVGWATLTTSGVLDESDSAMSYGLGADFAMTDKIRLGIEVNKYNFETYADEDYLDIKGSIVSLRVSYAF